MLMSVPEKTSGHSMTAASSGVMQIERADRRARRRAGVLVAIGAAAGLLIYWGVRSRLPALHAWIAQDPAQTPIRLKLIATGLAAAVAVPTLLFARHFWRLGNRVVRSNRYPPPGMRVIRDTVVWQGDSARRRGRMLQGVALILLFIVGGVVTILWRLVALFRSRSA
jgi:hypothetical protein